MHLGGTLEEIAAAEAAADAGGIAERPFVLLAQPTLFDPSRAPAGKHTGWAYCHVPNGSTARHDRRDRGADRALRARLPRPRSSRAPSMNAAEMEAYNPNYVGGDINGGVQDLRQLFTRPVARPVPYTTPDAAAVHLLVVDAAGRRRPRHVRLLRRPGGAQALGAKPGS